MCHPAPNTPNLFTIDEQLDSVLRCSVVHAEAALDRSHWRKQLSQSRLPGSYSKPKRNYRRMLYMYDAHCVSPAPAQTTASTLCDCSLHYAPSTQHILRHVTCSTSLRVPINSDRGSRSHLLLFAVTGELPSLISSSLDAYDAAGVRTSRRKIWLIASELRLPTYHYQTST